MKGKLIALASILCIASLVVSGASAKGKPDKPGNIESELIVFTGELAGAQEVENCCPNAGPFPEYKLTLNKELVFNDGSTYSIGDYDGQVFMNAYRVGKDRLYKVQFWTEGDDHICIEIYGGVKDYDKRTKVLTVTFDDVEWNVMHDLEPGEFLPTGVVSFVLTRSPI